MSGVIEPKGPALMMVRMQQLEQELSFIHGIFSAFIAKNGGEVIITDDDIEAIKHGGQFMMGRDIPNRLTRFRYVKNEPPATEEKNLIVVPGQS